MSQSKIVSPTDAQALLEQGHKYLDVRTQQEFEDGHPEGAYNVPFMLRGPEGMTPNPDFLAVVDKNFAKDEELIVGCRSGARSARAVEALGAAGFTKLSDMNAGWDGNRDAFGKLNPGWSRSELPVGNGKPSGRSYDDLK